jgi:hypothetical protein
MKLYMFGAVPLPIIRSLFTVHSAMVYVIQVCRQLSSRGKGLPQQAELAQGFPGRLRPRIFLLSALRGWKVVSLTHRPPLPQDKYLVLIFRR